jgi:hypothetical protein
VATTDFRPEKGFLNSIPAFLLFSDIDFLALGAPHSVTSYFFCLFPLVLTFVGWLLKQFMRIMPGPVTEWLINRGTERITKAANAICLKDYSSFLRSKEAPA